MKRPFIRSMLAGIALASATAAAAAPAVAAPSEGKPPGHAVARHEAATSTAEQRRIEAYWTPAKMDAAKPAEQYLAGKQKRGNGKGKGKKSAEAVQETPQPELGKVFFTLGGTDYVCSGTATTSGNSDVVTTAGHCLNEGPGGYATNFAFVPAYENGNRPYGTWTAGQLFTTTQWAGSGDFEYDAGFAVMNENSSGASLTDVVGSYPIAFNLSRGLTYKSYGYPAASPYDGELLWSCTGAAKDDPYGSTTQGIPCSMTGGSSGGGWITGGQLNSVNSYKYRTDSSTMYGPYFGSVIQSVYNAAAAA
ncbi:MAG: trypsin-like serine peptidase [Haloechinothrix sp.]